MFSRVRLSLLLSINAPSERVISSDRYDDDDDCFPPKLLLMRSEKIHAFHSIKTCYYPIEFYSFHLINFFSSLTHHLARSGTVAILRAHDVNDAL